MSGMGEAMSGWLEKKTNKLQVPFHVVRYSQLALLRVLPIAEDAPVF